MPTQAERLTVAKLKPQQRAVLEAQSEYIVIDGGVGTMKTTACVIRLASEARRNRRGEYMVLMQTYNQLHSVFLAEWKEQVPAHLWRIRHKPYHIEMIKSKTKIHLQYAGQPSAKEVIIGNNLDGYYISQAESFRDDELVLILEQRVRRPGRTFLRLIDSNGGSPGRIAYRRFINSESPEFIGENVTQTSSGDMSIYEGDTKSGARYTRIHIRTTPETSVYSAGQIAEWKDTFPETTYRRYVEGDFTVAEGAIYPMWSEAVHVEDFEPDPNWQWYRAIDFGKTNPFCCLWIGRDRDGRSYVLDEWYKTDTDITEHASVIMSRHTGYSFKSTICDPSGKKFIQALHQAGIKRIIKGVNDVAFGIDVMQTILKPDAEGAAQLVVHSRCVNLIREFPNYTWQPTIHTSKKPPEEPIKRDDHALDALRYYAATIVARKRANNGIGN